MHAAVVTAVERPDPTPHRVDFVTQLAAAATFRSSFSMQPADDWPSACTIRPLGHVTDPALSQPRGPKAASLPGAGR